MNAICYHLSHTVWQEQTEGLVRGLTASSLATFDRAELSLMKQEKVGIAKLALTARITSFGGRVEAILSRFTTVRGQEIVVGVRLRNKTQPEKYLHP